MPIDAQEAFQSIRFPYRNELDDGFILDVEFHQTEMGPTITLHNLLDTGPLALPLSVYTDIVDFLRSRGVIPSLAPAAAAAASRSSSPITGRATHALSPTRIMARTGSSVPRVEQPPEQSPQHTQEETASQYASQHGIFTAPKPVSAQRVPQMEPSAMNEPLPTLEEGKARRAAAGTGEKFGSLKRIVKPGEPGYEEM